MAGLVKGLKVGAVLRRIRLERRLSIQELAGLTGLSVSHLYKLEQDATSATLPVLKALDEVLGNGWEQNKKGAA